MSILSGVPTSIPVYSGSGKLVPLPIVLGGSTGVGSQNGASAVTVSQSAGLGISAFAGIFLDILAVMIVFSLIGVFVIVVVANRADPDPRGRRPQSVYYFVVSFVTLAIAVIGSAVVVTGVDVLVGNHSNAVSNAAARLILVGGLATVVSLVLLITHLRRGLDLARTDASPGPSRRVGQSYVASVAFVSVLSFLVLFVFSVYLVFALIAPGLFGSLGGRSDATRVLVVAAYLLLAAVVIWGTHRKLVTPGLGAIEGADESIQSEE
jgi:hypothetical protein